LQVYDELELGGLNDRQIGGLNAFEDATGVNVDQAVRLAVAWCVTRQATGLRVLAVVVNAGSL
jgi:hypothetical protein